MAKHESLKNLPNLIIDLLDSGYRIESHAFKLSEIDPENDIDLDIDLNKIEIVKELVTNLIKSSLSISDPVTQKVINLKSSVTFSVATIKAELFNYFIRNDNVNAIKEMVKDPFFKENPEKIPDLLDSYKRIATVSTAKNPDLKVIKGIIKEIIDNSSSIISKPILEKIINFKPQGRKLDFDDELINYSIKHNDFKIFDLRFDINTVNSMGNNALHIAIASELPDRVEQLIQKGIDVNEVNENYVEPFMLIKSLSDPDAAISILKLLIDSKQINLFEKPANESIPRYFYLFTNQQLLQNYDDPRVQSLFKQVFQSPQFSINQQFDKDKKTLLYFVIDNDYGHSTKLVQCLLKLNADPTLLSDSNTPLMLAKQCGAHPDTIQLLESISSDYSKKIIHQKMLGHRFGLDGEISDGKQFLGFEGFHSFFIFPELVKSLEQYFPPYPKELTEEDINAIKEAFKNSWVQHPREDPTWSQPKKIVQEIQNNQLVIIPSGYPGHIVDVVIKGDYLIKCNRGSRFEGTKAGLTVYKIHNKDNLQKAVRLLKFSGFLSKIKNYFFEGVDNDLGLEEVDHLDHKDQNVGNCSWASAKAAFRAALYLTFLEKGATPEQASVASRAIYKSWTKQDRLDALKEFIENFPNETQGIFQKQEVLKRIALKKQNDSEFTDLISPLHAAITKGDLAAFSQSVSLDPQKLLELDYKGQWVLDVALVHFSPDAFKSVLNFLVACNLSAQFLENEIQRPTNLFDRACQTNDPKKIEVVAEFIRTHFPDNYQQFIFRTLTINLVNNNPNLENLLNELVNHLGADINFIFPNYGTILDRVYNKYDHLVPLFQKYGAKTQAELESP